METIDQTGKLIKIGDKVLMPEPLDNDIWNHGNFVATIVDFHGGNLIVEDAYSDFFEIEPNRVVLIED